MPCRVAHTVLGKMLTKLIFLVICAWASVGLAATKTAQDRACEILTKCLPAIDGELVGENTTCPSDQETLQTYESSFEGYKNGTISKSGFFNLALVKNKGKVHEVYGLNTSRKMNETKNCHQKQETNATWTILGQSNTRVKLVGRVSRQLCNRVGRSVAFSVSREWSYELCENSGVLRSKQDDICFHLESPGPSMTITITLKKGQANWNPAQLDKNLSELFVGRIDFVTAIHEKSTLDESFLSYTDGIQFSPLQLKNAVCSSYDGRKEVCFGENPAVKYSKHCTMGNCQPGGVCVPVESRSSALNYTCICKEGYISWNGDCVDVDECSFTPPSDQAATKRKLSQLCPDFSICVNTVGSYKCECLPGWVSNPVGEGCSRRVDFQHGDDLRNSKVFERSCNGDNPDGDFPCYYKPKANLKRTWEKAQEYCWLHFKGTGGRLACGDVQWNEEENLRFLGSTFQAPIWLGLTAITVSNEQFQVDCNNYTAVRSLGGPQGRCMFMSDVPVHWTHYDCNKELKPICEINVSVKEGSRQNELDSTTTTTVSEEEECPEGWVSSEAVPGSCYQTLDILTAGTFEKSAQDCRSSLTTYSDDDDVYEPHLLVIDSAAENEFIGEHFKTMTWTGFQTKIWPENCPGREIVASWTTITSSNDLVGSNSKTVPTEDLEWRSHLDGTKAQWTSFLGNVSFGQFGNHPVMSGDVPGALTLCSAIIPSIVSTEDCSKELPFVCETELV